MDFILNRKKMMDLLESFHTIVNAKVGLHDFDGKGTLGYPKSRTDYCSLIQSRENGKTACKECDQRAYHQAAKMDGAYIYTCHAFLTEIVAPITIADDKRIGYLMIGQARQTEFLNDRQWKDLEVRFKFTQAELVELKNAYSKLPVLKLEQSKACAKILQCLAVYVWFDNLFRTQNKPLSVKVKEYIAKNLDKKLSLMKIARAFQTGKTTLCKSIMRDYNLTVNQLIRSLRVDRAKQLLQTEKIPIYIISEQVGIEDYNYFTKVFKESTGVTPSVFRKLCEEEYMSSHGSKPAAALSQTV